MKEDPLQKVASSSFRVATSQINLTCSLVAPLPPSVSLCSLYPLVLQVFDYPIPSPTPTLEPLRRPSTKWSRMAKIWCKEMEEGAEGEGGRGQRVQQGKGLGKEWNRYVWRGTREPQEGETPILHDSTPDEEPLADLCPFLPARCLPTRRSAPRSSWPRPPSRTGTSPLALSRIVRWQGLMFAPFLQSHSPMVPSQV